MTNKCYDIGTIQAFLDGELAFGQSEAVAHHVAACDDCAMMLAVADEESSLAFDALEQEFNTLVPTQRLWTKINDSIEQEKKSFWTPIFAFFKQPSIAAFAGLIVVVGLFALVLSRGTVDETNLAVNNLPPNAVVIPISNPIPSGPPTAQTLTTQPVSQFRKVADSKNDRTVTRPIQASFVKENREKPIVKPGKTNIIKNSSTSPSGETLAGEDSYIKTIATLTETVKNRKDEVMKPSARFAFERDLAFADNAIETMKREIKQNPKDNAAKQILRASYQNKIDLLNSVADKTELMASIK
jgi:ribosomal protein S15P/S13E